MILCAVTLRGLSCSKIVAYSFVLQDKLLSVFPGLATICVLEFRVLRIFFVSGIDLWLLRMQYYFIRLC